MAKTENRTTLELFKLKVNSPAQERHLARTTRSVKAQEPMTTPKAPDSHRGRRPALRRSASASAAESSRASLHVETKNVPANTEMTVIIRLAHLELGSGPPTR